jgi:4-amino-4-deoxy-L-arabinose transferase-like glycosyltransferase
MKKALSFIKSIEGYKWAMAITLFEVVYHFVLVLFIIFSRINYRYDLEWMEGASLIQVYRISTGQILYLKPSLAYIPMIYPPLYFYLSAVLAKITSISFLPLRIISFTSTLGCLLIIFYAVKNKTNSAVIGFVAAGSFVATFKLGGAWFDIARVDMLFIFLCLTGIYYLGKQTIQSSIIAGLLFSLSFLTKQTALPIFAILAVSTFLLFRKQTLAFFGSFTIVTLSVFLYLNSSTNGWYQYYILSLPAIHQIKWSIMATALQSGFQVEAIIIIVGFSPLIFGIRHIIKDRLCLYYYFAVIGLIGTSILARINRGAYINTLVPAYAGLSIIFGIGIGWLMTHYDFKRFGKNWFQFILWLAISIQFIWLGYNPFQQIPTQADRRAGDALVSKIQSASGNVLIPYHNYLSLLAGKKVNFHMVTFDEIRGTYSKKQPVLKDILTEFHSTPFSLLIMDLPDNLIQKNHCVNTQNIIYESAATFVPVTGYSVRPTIQYSDCP